MTQYDVRDVVQMLQALSMSFCKLSDERLRAQVPTISDCVQENVSLLGGMGGLKGLAGSVVERRPSATGEDMLQPTTTRRVLSQPLPAALPTFDVSLQQHLEGQAPWPC